MSAEEERKEVFAWFGAASYYAQCVEKELLIARLMMARGDDEEPSEEEWERIENERRTMGGLLRFVRQGVSLEADEDRVLKECLEKRNYLAHDFWYECSHLLATTEGCKKALNELGRLCDLLKEGNEIGQRISARVRAEVGISEAVVQRLQEEFAERLRTGEPQKTILEDLKARMKRLSARVAELKSREQE